MTHISGKTTLLGLLGYPVSHSFSPAMHNAAATELGLDYAYVPLPVHPGQLGSAVAGLKALGFRGVNVTIPHKQAVMAHLDHINEAAQTIGAVNTIVIEADGTTTGHNTDWSGFLADLEAKAGNVSGRPCVVLGAGGSARAVVYALSTRNCPIHIYARRLEQAQTLAALAANCQAHSLSELAQSQLAAPIIVNTTPIGMHPHINQSPWPDQCPMLDGAFVYDLVYNPATTLLNKQASAAGCGTSSGLGMLLLQGAHAFELWTGQAPDLAVMRQALVD